MADVQSPLGSYAEIDKLIADQKAAMNATPQGVFSQLDPAVLGLAQGLLSPTKTGGFGESVGLGLAGLQGPLEAMRKQQTAAKDKYQELLLAKAKLDMEKPYYDARANYFQEKNDPKTMSESDLLRNMARVKGILESGQLSRDEEAATKLILQDYTNELTKRRGIQTPEKPAEAPVDVDKTSGGGFWDWLTGRGESPQQPKQAEPAPQEPVKAPAPKAQDAAVSSQPQETPQPQQSDQYYSGEKPPKEFPGALKAPDGRWYVVKEGKKYPVLK